jgi:hypothetical protein
MKKYSRRAMLSATAVPFLPSSVSAAVSDKTEFMKTAIADITNKLRAQSPVGKGGGSITDKFKDLSHAGKIVNFCIPVPFADFDYYYTDGALEWLPNPGQKLGPVIVPHGFCTDLTSIPQPVWSLLPKLDDTRMRRSLTTISIGRRRRPERKQMTFC